MAQKQWPGAKLWPIAKIKEYPKNPKKHPPEQITLLAAAIKRWGPDQPIVVDEDGVILKGHGRKAAAMEAGLSQFPVVQHGGLSESEKKAMRVADNQLALLGGWDDDLLTEELVELKADGFELELLGFDKRDLNSYLPPPEEEKNPNEIVIPPKKSIVRAGDIWELGQHRIICGDSTDMKTWQTLMGSDRAAMVFTDPPYGVSYQGGDFDVIEGDHKRRDDLYKMLVGAFKCLVRIADDKAGFYVWHASSTRNDFAQALTAAGLAEKQYLIWAKPGLVLGRADYQWAHEPAFYCAKDGESPHFYGDRAESTVWRVASITTDQASTVLGPGVLVLDGNGRQLFIQAKAPKTKKVREIRLTESTKAVVIADSTGTGTVWEVGRETGYVHPTQKPVALALRAIENSSKAGDIVVDAFSGSGSTTIACEMLGRRARVSELDPKYVEVAIERWQRFTNKSATLDGKTFEEVRSERERENRRQAKKSHIKGVCSL